MDSILSLLHRINEVLKQPASASLRAEARNRASRKVFVVHGRNLLISDAIFAFLKSIGLHPLEWSEAITLTNKPSPYIGEILDIAFQQAQTILVLFTPDDKAHLHQDFWKEGDPGYEKTLTSQARPNVLFEAGMAIGRDEKRTVFVQFGEMRPFSDIAGRYIMKWDDTVEKRRELAERLANSGCPTDLKGRKWKAAGNFTPPQKAVLEVAPRNSFFTEDEERLLEEVSALHDLEAKCTVRVLKKNLLFSNVRVELAINNLQEERIIEVSKRGKVTLTVYGKRMMIDEKVV